MELVRAVAYVLRNYEHHFGTKGPIHRPTESPRATAARDWRFRSRGF
ncbi:MAG: hypothetical protein ABR567_06070 [Myxococcales bacterium]